MPRKKPKPDAEKLRGSILQEVLHGKDLPHLSELAEQFVIQWGGAAAFAKELRKMFKEAAPAGVVQVKIMDMVLRCIRLVMDSRVPVGDLGIVSDEDLEKLFGVMIERSGYGRAKEGTAEEAANPSSGESTEDDAATSPVHTAASCTDPEPLHAAPGGAGRTGTIGGMCPGDAVGPDGAGQAAGGSTEAVRAPVGPGGVSSVEST